MRVVAHNWQNTHLYLYSPAERHRAGEILHLKGCNAFVEGQAIAYYSPKQHHPDWHGASTGDLRGIEESRHVLLE